MTFVGWLVIDDRSTGAVVNAYTYDVYGNVTSSSGSQPNEFQFAGEQTDLTGLQYLRARYYDTASGTFVSRDPLSSMPGWGGHPFGYVDGNPIDIVDPFGLDGSPLNPYVWASLVLGPSCKAVSDAADYIGGVGDDALQLVKLSGEYGLQLGDNLGDFLADNKDILAFATSQVLAAGVQVCWATGFGAAGGPWGVAACAGAFTAYAGFATWYISDSDSDFEALVRVINSIPGRRGTVSVAKAVFDAVTSALEPEPGPVQ